MWELGLDLMDGEIAMVSQNNKETSQLLKAKEKGGGEKKWARTAKKQLLILIQHSRFLREKHRYMLVYFVIHNLNIDFFMKRVIIARSNPFSISHFGHTFGSF